MAVAVSFLISVAVWSWVAVETQIEVRVSTLVIVLSWTLVVSQILVSVTGWVTLRGTTRYGRKVSRCCEIESDPDQQRGRTRQSRSLS